MFVTMNLYQNGDITIIQKDSEWDDSNSSEILSTNFFKLIRNQDSYGIIDLFKKYEDILAKYNQLKCTVKKYDYISLEEARGELLETVVLLDIENFRFLNSSTSLKRERNILEKSLAEITNSLLAKAKTFQKEALKQQREALKKVTEELSGVNLDG